MFEFTFDEDAVMDELGIATSEVVFQQQVVKQIQSLVHDRVGIRVEMALEDDAKQIFNEFLESGAEDKASELLHTELPGYTNWYSEELEAVTKLLKQSLAQ